MGKQISLRCARSVCGVEFLRCLSEHKRSIKLGRLEYCSRVCQAIDDQNLGIHLGSDHRENLKADNRRDQFSDFRYYLRTALARHPESTLTFDEIKQQWERQQGLCSYTQLPLTLYNGSKKSTQRKSYEKASLDRIDSALPYTATNIQFVSLSINYLKNDMSDADTKECIRRIRAV